MPKKESAKDKAASKAQAEAEARAKAAEDASWADEDKGKSKKDSKKVDAEAKKMEEMQRKLERKRLEEEELAAASKASKAPPKKLTQFEIQQSMSAPAAKSKVKSSIEEEELDRNINHVLRESEEHLKNSGIERHVATGVNEAADLLKNLSASGSESPDAHPERRRKAAYKAYEDREIPRIREENPGLKLSQVKEIIFKNWQKSPENPMNDVAE